MRLHLLFKIIVFGLIWLSFSLPVYAVGEPPVVNLHESIVEGAIDFHIHSSPDVIPRRLDDFEVAESAARSHMKAVVLKNHYGSTAARAVLVNKIVPQIEVFGGIVLNHSVGGINPDAVEAMHRIGGKYGKVVWLPTVDSEHHLQVFGKSGIGIKVAENGQVLPETAAVLKIVARNNLVLETGHISSEEVMAVVRQAKLLNIKNILITHAMADVPGLSLENMQTAAQMGAFLELAFVNDLMGENAADDGHKNWHHVSINQMVTAIQLIGAEHFVLSTDLGRKPDPLPAEGYKLFVEKLMDEGISQREIDLMSKENPAQLLGI
ncbi:histidinol phosphatase [Lyngbya sp. CCAP 1446/10]|uniref:DUF6282 family protein n=1 Tax=Lyngbya sp. CCAP 1446/10 TaxID=439293 RepID=UPI002237383C|nr:DUF6282 family protein [Lyngbya sp. CCAP 1446/10]MCW6051956.1 histidinol phosphatase [Lyngbya sp. CCAP 1446/10]